jgi:hypothetical protein
LLDIDTPETKKNIYESRDIMIELLDESKLLDITIYCYEFDKYGRVFIRLSINHIEYGLIKDVSTWIIENGYCKPYIV